MLSRDVPQLLGNITILHQDCRHARCPATDLFIFLRWKRNNNESTLPTSPDSTRLLLYSSLLKLILHAHKITRTELWAQVTNGEDNVVIWLAGDAGWAKLQEKKSCCGKIVKHWCFFIFYFVKFTFEIGLVFKKINSSQNIAHLFIGIPLEADWKRNWSVISLFLWKIINLRWTHWSFGLQWGNWEFLIILLLPGYLWIVCIAQRIGALLKCIARLCVFVFRICLWVRQILLLSGCQVLSPDLKERFLTRQGQIFS